MADLRIHGTTHQRPIERFAEEARVLVPAAGHPSFLAAMVRERIVAEHPVLAGRAQLSVQPPARARGGRGWRRDDRKTGQ